MPTQTIDAPYLDPSKVQIPTIRVNKIRFQNYKVFDNVTFDFKYNKETHPFACFYGPNGCGKTTVLDAIQLVFSRLEGY